MHVRLVAVGKVRERPVSAICAEFQKRLRRYHRLEIVEVAAARGSDPAAAVRAESDRILRSAREGSLWLLDRSGTELDSAALSRKITELETSGVRSLTLIVGGAFGVSRAVRDRADFVWSLSALTFLHEWARMIVLEQLYRAAKIARSEPYHH